MIIVIIIPKSKIKCVLAHEDTERVFICAYLYKLIVPSIKAADYMDLFNTKRNRSSQLLLLSFSLSLSLSLSFSQWFHPLVCIQ